MLKLKLMKTLTLTLNANAQHIINSFDKHLITLKQFTHLLITQW